MEENTLINSSTCIVSGSEGENLGDYRSSDYYDDDNGIRYQRKDVSFVWDGWEAALIVSQRNMACQVDTRDYYAVRVPKKEDNTRVMTLEEYETHLGGRLGKHWSLKEEAKSSERFLACVILIRQSMMTHGVAQSKKDNTSRLEDFERIYNRRVVEDEFSEFCAKLESYKCDPLVAVAEEKVKVDQFSTLREHDLCVRIQQYQSSADEEFFMQHQSSDDEEFFMQYQTSAEEEFSMGNGAIALLLGAFYLLSGCYSLHLGHFRGIFISLNCLSCKGCTW